MKLKPTHDNYELIEHSIIECSQFVFTSRIHTNERFVMAFKAGNNRPYRLHVMNIESCMIIHSLRYENKYMIVIDQIGDVIIRRFDKELNGYVHANSVLAYSGKNSAILQTVAAFYYIAGKHEHE